MDRGAKCCVTMDKTSTNILDPAGNERNFTFDYSFWSHDGFSTRPDGILVPSGKKYADQPYVYSVLGKEVLDNAWNGYHCSLFAYG